MVGRVVDVRPDCAVGEVLLRDPAVEDVVVERRRILRLWILDLHIAVGVVEVGGPVNCARSSETGAEALQDVLRIRDLEGAFQSIDMGVVRARRDALWRD